MLPYFHVFMYPIPTYWLCSMLGIGFCSLYVLKTNKKKICGDLPAADAVHILILAAVGAIIGSKILFALTMIPVIVRDWAMLVQNPLQILNMLMGGLVFYGGLFGGLIAGGWYCRRYKIDSKIIIALFAPAIPLFHVFGRIGCFLGGCCWGVECSLGFTFTQSIAAPNGISFFPIQLVEAAGNLILFIVLAVTVRRIARKWMVLPLYFVLYGTMRFILEFFRGDKIRGVFLFSTSQWISLFLIAGVVFLYCTRWRSKSPSA